MRREAVLDMFGFQSLAEVREQTEQWLKEYNEERPDEDEFQTYIAKDDVTGEDPEVRRIAVNALGNHAGTVVVMDPMTGRVYSMVNQEWPLRRGFKPCSTINLVIGVAGLLRACRGS